MARDASLMQSPPRGARATRTTAMALLSCLALVGCLAEAPAEEEPPALAPLKVEVALASSSQQAFTTDTGYRLKLHKITVGLRRLSFSPCPSQRGLAIAPLSFGAPGSGALNHPSATPPAQSSEPSTPLSPLAPPWQDDLDSESADPFCGVLAAYGDKEPWNALELTGEASKGDFHTTFSVVEPLALKHWLVFPHAVQAGGSLRLTLDPRLLLKGVDFLLMDDDRQRLEIRRALEASWTITTNGQGADEKDVEMHQVQ